MSYTVFADESGITKDYACYGLGAFAVPTAELDSFNSLFASWKDHHGCDSELKWKDISTSHGAINFTLELVWHLLRSRSRFSCMVVKKDEFRNWRISPEDAFYQSYSFLLRHLAQTLEGDHVVHLDKRSNRYPKHDEVVEIVTNHMLRNDKGRGRLGSVTQEDSRLHAGIQAADLLTGAVACAHNLYLKPQTPVHAGKRLLLERMSTMLGWPALHFDTRPNVSLNIWHFPTSYRAMPETMWEIHPCESVPWVTPAQLRDALQK